MTTAKQVEFLLAGYRHPTTNRPLAGGKVETFLDGTSTLSALWTDANKGGVSTNPVILDSAGKAEVYGDNIYKFRIYDSSDNFIEEITGLEYRNVLKTIDDPESIAELRLISGTVQNETVQVLGYYSVGDGGGGPLRYWSEGQPPGTYIDNGGSIIVPNGGDGSEAWLWVYQGVTDVLWWGAKNATGFDSQPFVQVAIDYCYANQCKLTSTGYIEIDNPLVFENPSGVAYWDNTTYSRPPVFEFDVIKCNSTNIGIDIDGSIVGIDIKINTLTGPGVTTLQTPGGGAERIGVSIKRNRHTVDINTISDFNINILFDGAYDNIVDVGTCFAAIYGIHSRVGIANGSNNQANTIRYGIVGGVFTSSALSNDTLRRSRGCKYGIYMEQGNGFYYEGGALNYCQRDDTSIAIVLEDANNNKFNGCYLEGARAEGYYIECQGDNNKFYLYEMRSSMVNKESVNITGIGNVLDMLPGRVSEASEAVTTSEASSGTITVAPGNKYNGKNAIIESQTASKLAHNFITNKAITLTGDGSYTTVSDFPEETDGASAYEITCNSDTTVFFDWAATSLASETLRTIQFHTWLKGNTNHAKLAFYVLDSTSGDSICDPIGTGLSPTSGWQKLTSKTNITTPASGSIRIRLAIRNTISGETGCVVRVYPPVVTFNIDTSDRDITDALPNTDVVKGKLVPEEQLHLRTLSYYVQNVTDIVGTAISTAGRGLVNITGAATGTSINSIVNMRENTTVTIVNSYSSSITFTTSAGEWTTSFALAPGEAVNITDIGGSRYILRS